MIDLKQDGITQKIISILTGVSPSSVSRYVNSTDSIKPLDNASIRNIKYNIETSRKIIHHLGGYSKDIYRKVHAFYNFKGGTGKTSICYQVSSHIALMGYSVLVIDADPQGHLSTSCGFSHNDNNLTLFDCIVRKRKISDVVKNIFEGYDCIPSDLSLTRLEVELNQMPKREERLSLELDEIKDKYDFVFIDTNPTISLVNRNVITFSDVINIVTETQPYSLNGLKLLIEDLVQFFHHMRLEPCELNIIPNKYEDRTSSSAEGMTALREYYKEFVQDNFAIRKSEDINTSAKIGKPLALFAKKNSIALEDVVELCNYILSMSIKNKK